MNSNREQDFYFSDPIFQDGTVFFHLKRTPFLWETMDDLKRLRIGSTSAYNYGDAFRAAKHAGKLPVERVPKDIQNFRKLLRQRAALVPLEMPLGYYILQNMFTPEGIAEVTHPPKGIKSGLIFAYNQGYAWAGDPFKL